VEITSQALDPLSKAGKAQAQAFSTRLLHSHTFVGNSDLQCFSSYFGFHFLSDSSSVPECVVEALLNKTVDTDPLGLIDFNFIAVNRELNPSGGALLMSGDDILKKFRQLFPLDLGQT